MKLMVVEPFHWDGSLLARGTSLEGSNAEKIAADPSLRRQCVLVGEPSPPLPPVPPAESAVAPSSEPVAKESK